MAIILVVDDEIGIRELLSEILNDEGYEVLLAENAAAARFIYTKQVIDLVLLDIWMPDMDGMSVLREWVNTKKIYCPIVMMSGHASLDTAIEAQNLGAAGFLEKPITLHKLLSTVHKILAKKNTFKINTPLIDSAITNTVEQENDLNNTDYFTSLDSPSTHIEGVESINTIQSTADLTVHAQINTFIPNINNLSQPLNTNKGYNSVSHNTNVPPQVLSIWHEALSKIPLDTELRDFREAAERIYFNYVLHTEHGSMTRVAEISGLERTHLYRKLKQLNVDFLRKPSKHNKKY